MEFDRYREAAQKRYPRPFKDPSSWQRADPSPTTWNDAQSHDAQQQRELYAQTERYQRPTYPASVQASEAMSMSNSRFNFVQDLHKVSHSKANMSWTVLSPIEPAQFPSALKPKQRMKRLLPDVDDVADNTSEGSLATLSSPSTESQLMYDSKSESSNRKSVHEEEDSPLHISFTNHRGHDLSDGSEGEKEKNLKLRMQIVELQNQLSLAKQMVKNAYFESSDNEQDEMYNTRFMMEDRIRISELEEKVHSLTSQNIKLISEKDLLQEKMRALEQQAMANALQMMKPMRDEEISKLKGAYRRRELSQIKTIQSMKQSLNKTLHLLKELQVDEMKWKKHLDLTSGKNFWTKSDTERGVTWCTWSIKEKVISPARSTSPPSHSSSSLRTSPQHELSPDSLRFPVLLESDSPGGVGGHSHPDMPVLASASLVRPPYRWPSTEQSVMFDSNTHHGNIMR